MRMVNVREEGDVEVGSFRGARVVCDINLNGVQTRQEIWSLTVDPGGTRLPKYC